MEVNRKKLLVIGASGLIGSEVCRQAKIRKMDVIGTSSHLVDGLISYRLDRDNPEDLLRRCGFEDGEGVLAVLAGAVTNIRECHEKKELSRAVNVDGICRLAETLHRHGIRMIFLSSDAVFDGTRSLWMESDAPNPLCEYGRQKVQAEKYLLENIPSILIYRLSKQVGASLEKKHIFHELYLQAQEKMRIRCIEGLRFQPTDVRDTAACILDGLSKGLSGLYHVANPQVFSRYKLSKLFFDLLYMQADIVECSVDEFSFAESKALDTSMDIGKFQSVFNYGFRSMESVINEIVARQQ